jgi:CYTH domain-containing protein
MKFEVTNPKAWKAVNEKNIPMSHKIKVYEKLGGAYRLGENGGEQVFNKMTELLKHKINEGPETQDHEVSMAGGQLDDIIRNATELKGKVGEQEMNLPGWIQDHISQAQNFINQANTGFHKLDGGE